MFRLSSIVFSAWLLIALAGVAHAAKRVALVIGNSAYRNATPLINPLNDATDIAKRFRSLDFDVVEGIDLDMEGMRRTVREFIRKTEGADIAVFFYAGHGLQVSGTNYLAPVDAALESAGDLQFETLPVEFVLGPMEINAKTSIVFLDACRNNPLARNLARSMGTRSAAVGRGLAAIGSGVGTLISYATQPGNVALDGEGRNSPFTTALLAHIGKPGVGLTATMASVRRDVLAATNGNQVPWEHSSLTGKVIFKPGTDTDPADKPSGPTANTPANPPSSPDIELALWKAIEGSGDPALFEDYLSRYPDGVFSTVARKRIALLRKPGTPPKPDPPKSGSGITVTLRPESHCGFSMPWFSAAVRGTNKLVSLCGSDSLDGGNAWLFYHFGPQGLQELVFPKGRDGSMSAFTYRRLSRPGSTYLKFEFNNGGYNYAILEDHVSKKSSAQLRVTRMSTGNVIARFELAMKTPPLSLMQLENRVPTKPYDE